MKQLTFAVQNSVARVLERIEKLGRLGDLSGTGFRLLQLLYVLGWDDGFAEIDRHDTAAALRVAPLDLDGAILELVELDLVCLREAQRNEIVELLALSSPRLTNKPEICWWQFYFIELIDSRFEDGDDSDASDTR